MSPRDVVDEYVELFVDELLLELATALLRDGNALQIDTLRTLGKIVAELALTMKKEPAAP